MSASGGDPFVGRVFKDAYRIESKLGEGGFGAVYAATQLAVDRPVAVKVLRPDRLAHDEALRTMLTSRFQREAVATSRLMHPNTVRLIDFGQSADGVLFLVLELLKGFDLADIITRDAPMDPARVARIGQQISQSLSEAHGLGIIHRDLKPSNVFLQDFHGVRDFVKVMDFGIARVVAADSAQVQLTRTGTVQGTPRYMAPEQAMAMPTGPSADLYALGCILYEMLTGGPVFDADTLLAISLAHVQTPPPHLVLPGAPAALTEAWDAVIQLLLRKNPATRPQTGTEVVALLRDLEAASSVAQIVRPPDAFAATDIAPATPSDAAWPSTPAIAPPSLAIQKAPTAASAVGLETFGDGRTAITVSPRRSRVPLFIAGAALLVAGASGWFVFTHDPTIPETTRDSLTTSAATAVSAAPDRAGTPADSSAPTLDPNPAAGPGALAAAGAAPGGAPPDHATAPAAEPATAPAVAVAPDPVAAPDPAVAPDPVAAEPAPEPEPAPAAEPAPATLAVTSRPPGATVYRGASPEAPALCVTPCDDIQIAPGTAAETLILRLNGHRDTSIRARLDPGTTFRAAAILKALPPAAPTRSHGTRRPSTAAPARVTASPPSAAPGSATSTTAPPASRANTPTATSSPAEPSSGSTAPRSKLPRLREAKPTEPTRKLPGLRTDDAE